MSNNQTTSKMHSCTREKKAQSASLGSGPPSFNGLSAVCCFLCTLWVKKAKEPGTQHNLLSTQSGHVCPCDRKRLMPRIFVQTHRNTHTHTHTHFNRRTAHFTIIRRFSFHMKGKAFRRLNLRKGLVYPRHSRNPLVQLDQGIPGIE